MWHPSSPTASMACSRPKRSVGTCARATTCSSAREDGARDAAVQTARFAADRLVAVASTRSTRAGDAPLEVLFVCAQNSGRSQLGAAILTHLAGDLVHVRSAGSRPVGAVRSTIIEALGEIGVSIGAEFPKPLTDEVVRAADLVITMGCGDACPVYPGRRYLDWELDDLPAGPWRGCG